MIDPKVSSLVERNAVASQVVARAAANLSSCCRTPIQGTSAVLWCGQCGHTIRAADIDHEYKPSPATVIHNALDEIAKRPVGRHLPAARAEIEQRLTAAIEAGDWSWATASAIVMDAHDSVAATQYPGFTIGNDETDQITAALHVALTGIGAGLTTTTAAHLDREVAL